MKLPVSFLAFPMLLVFLSGCHIIPGRLDSYTTAGGQIWRQFRDGEISREEYLVKMKMLREVDDQWEAWSEVAVNNLRKMSESDWKEMDDYKVRIDRRMQEIVDWEPDEDPKVSQADSEEPDIFEPADAIGHSHGLPVSMARDIHAGNEHGRAEDIHDYPH